MGNWQLQHGRDIYVALRNFIFSVCNAWPVCFEISFEPLVLVHVGLVSSNHCCLLSCNWLTRISWDNYSIWLYASWSIFGNINLNFIERLFGTPTSFSKICNKIYIYYFEKDKEIIYFQNCLPMYHKIMSNTAMLCLVWSRVSKINNLFIFCLPCGVSWLATDSSYCNVDLLLHSAFYNINFNWPYFCQP